MTPMPEVTLRPIRVEDAERCYQWDTDPDVGRHLGLTNMPVDVQHERSWLAQVIADTPHQRMFIIETEEGRPIGSCSLRGIDAVTGIATFGILIGDPRYWGRGYGTAATRALLRYAFEELGLREVRLSCHHDNARALACYRRVGFLPSAYELPHRVFGRAEMTMAITRDRWEELGRAAT